jgi:anaerobic nitric oxide reductase transcription regulator
LLVPALRDRGRDVLLLSGFFLEQNRSRMGLNSLRLSNDAQAALLAYAWPGNVRELEHLIGRSALKALGSCKERPKILSLSAADLDLPNGSVEVASEQPTAVPVAGGVSGDLREATENYQRQLISACLERHHDNWASAARELGLDRANLGRMAKRLGMK